MIDRVKKCFRLDQPDLQDLKEGMHLKFEFGNIAYIGLICRGAKNTRKKVLSDE